MEPISATIATAAAKDLSASVASLAKAIGESGLKKLKKVFGTGFNGHLEETQNRCSRIKNILYRDQPVDFLSQYVSVSFSVSKRLVTDNSFLFNVKSGTKVIITGTAGAGKTMFMRWLALAFIKQIAEKEVIPIYLELRYFLSLI